MRVTEGLLALPLILAQCGCFTPVTRSKAAGHVKPEALTNAVTPAINWPPQDSARQDGKPILFRGVDFRNFSCPAVVRHYPIKLKSGSYERADRNGVGGERFDFEHEFYVD